MLPINHVGSNYWRLVIQVLLASTLCRNYLLLEEIVAMVGVFSLEKTITHKGTLE